MSSQMYAKSLRLTRSYKMDITLWASVRVDNSCKSVHMRLYIISISCHTIKVTATTLLIGIHVSHVISQYHTVLFRPMNHWTHWVTLFVIVRNHIHVCTWDICIPIYLFADELLLRDAPNQRWRTWSRWVASTRECLVFHTVQGVSVYVKMYDNFSTLEHMSRESICIFIQV